ncbi:MAG: Asp23/Gls24 family envelope stress response protein [Chloroflexota bacterium]|nr:Asp23/Gls24 family envelope stress response protein [Chloroflexota bacterium]PLS77311.1 MAG: hypothetical protein CYG59_24390 [Chloroflexota bacterium]
MPGPNGTVTMSPIALIGIISRTAQDVQGVVRMGAVPPSRVGQLLTGSHTRDGVLVRVGGGVSADVYLVAQSDAQLLDLGQQVQAAIAHAIGNMVGMDVREVNVYIQDVEAARG